MQVLIIGANGFIGSYITAAFLKAGFEVVCAVRDVETTKRRFPLAKVIFCDFNQDIESAVWHKRLENIDIVVNVAGLLNTSGKNKIENVHIKGPKALFDACSKSNVKRVIHISALGIEQEKTTDYSITKNTADQYLESLDNIDWVILQPSLVYATGCYGGTSLLRALASFPFFIPLIDNGLQEFQPIHMKDLTDVVLYCATREGEIKRVLKIVGPEIITVKDILVSFRKWMGLGGAAFIKIPSSIIKLLAKFGDFIGDSPLSTTSYKMMMHPNIADKKEFIEFTGITPIEFQKALSTEPLTVQSLWHARLFLLKPLFKLGLGLFWIATGIITLAAPLHAMQIIDGFGFEEKISKLMLYSSCLLDVVLGASMILKPRIAIVGSIQIMVIIAYTIMLSIYNPALWLEPLGDLTKNIPIIFLTLMLLAIDRDK